MTRWWSLGLVIVTGNPGVTARDPYPTRGNPYPSTRVGVSAGRGRGLEGFFLLLGVVGSLRVFTQVHADSIFWEGKLNIYIYTTTYY